MAWVARESNSRDTIPPAGVLFSSATLKCPALLRRESHEASQRRASDDRSVSAGTVLVQKRGLKWVPECIVGSVLTKASYVNKSVNLSLICAPMHQFGQSGDSLFVGRALRGTGMTVIYVNGHPYPRGQAVEFHVHGITHENSDDRSRQRVAAKLSVGDPVWLVREPRNRFDHNAVRIDTKFGGVGYVPAGDAPGIAAKMDRGVAPKAFVQWVGGGTIDKLTRGVGVIADFDDPLPAAEPTSSSWLRRLLGLA